ncbi:stereocilin [Pyxicephalus adspersus]|uniref:stereocilin n=1 Tax=Pyxicephalus adspersus TaxID=30357 RepID=UPI003B5A930E
MLSEGLKDKHSNSSRFSSLSEQEEVQNVLEIIYRSKDKERETTAVDAEGSPENVVWDVLEDLRYNLMKRMERSVYDNLNRKVSRMKGTLMNRVSSVIGIPHADQNGKCSVGNLQQLLLWGIKHNVSWNVHSLGFTSSSFPSAPPILTCGKPAWKTEVKAHNISKRSQTEVLEEPQPYTEVLEAVCNDSISGLPGVSNFTVFLYCNVYNATGYSVDTTYDLQAACSDAAWYLSSMEEDSFWVWVCREYFPLEFNTTVCKNTSFSKRSQDLSIMSDLCTNVFNSSEAVRELRNNIKCSELWQGVPMNPKSLKACLFDNKTFLIEKLCSNNSISSMPEDTRVWVIKLCERHMVKTMLNANYSSCNYKSWDSNSFQNTTLVEECKGINMQDFKDLVCKNVSLYFSLKAIHPWVVDYCWKNASFNGKCFLQRLADALPLSPSFDTSQLCKNPVSYIIGLISQLSQCDSESYGWALNVQYLLKMLDFLFTFSDPEQIGKETRDRLGEAILLSSLLDNSSFWASFKKNSSLSILQTVELYLEMENSDTNKEDLLSCFSPVLWELIQKEENATALEILLQEYLHMPKEGFQKVLMSAENDAVERFLSLMHRSWPRIQVSQPDEKGLESLTSMVIQKFPRLTPQIFVDLSQFIPFMSISDIVSFPLYLLANQSVLEAIRIHSPDMKIAQKRAFVKRLLQANMFGDIPSWPPHFLESVQPLLPYLPFCHFIQLSPEQIKLLADGWKDVNLGMMHGRFVAQCLMNQSQDVDKIQRLEGFLCYLTYEDLQNLQPFHYPLGVLEKKLLECISKKTLSPHGRLAYSLVNVLRNVNVHSLDFNELVTWRSLLSELGVSFFHTLPHRHVNNLLTQLQAADLSLAQLAEKVICGLHSLIPVLSPDYLRSLPSHLLTRACQCLGSSLALLSAAQKAAIMQSLRQMQGNGMITAEEMDLLGPLFGFIGEENISVIHRKHLLLHLDELKMYCISEEFSRHLGQILVEDDMLGHPSKWTDKHIEQIGRLIFHLTPETLSCIPKDMLGQDILEWLLESQREWEDSEIGIICTKQNSHIQSRVRKIKKLLASALTKNGFRISREPIPSCSDMRATFPSAWSAAQISGMSLSDFEGCLNIITEDADLSVDQAKAALGKIKQLFGPVKSMSLVQILQMGQLIAHMAEKDLNEMDTSDWAVVSFLGRMNSWTPKQMKTLVFNILKEHKKMASDLDLMELTALGHLLCGLGIQEIKQMNIQEFSQAAVFVGTLKLKCSETQLETLADLITSSSAFGAVSRWGPEIFTEIGTLAAGLPDIVLSSLISDQIHGLTPDAISLIPAPKFAVVFSPAQLSSFTSDQAMAVSPEQYEHLSNQQRQAISSAQYEGEVHQDSRGENSMGSHVAWNPAIHVIAMLLILL